jgi:hypothetical protein
LVKIPDLNGKWTGMYENKYKTSNIELEISQTLSTISCKIVTNNGVSMAYSTNLLYEIEKQYKKLVITYHYEQLSNQYNKDHRGTYDLIIDEKNNILKGSYWTNKPSKGKIISLKKHNNSLDDE